MTQTSDPIDTDQVDDAETGTGAATPSEPASGLSRRTAGLLLALAAVMLVAGGAAWWQARAVTADGPADNLALYDGAASNQVEAQVGTGLARVLSYDYANPDATRAAADDLLRGSARAEFDRLFSALVDLAPQQELSLTAKVNTIAVQELDDDSARLLVFLDQTSTRGTDGQSSVGAAQVQVDASLDGDTWRIDTLDIR